ncbi:hypothetical protein ACFL0P_00285 [Candidatus Omnitrophota bacterium]
MKQRNELILLLAMSLFFYSPLSAEAGIGQKVTGTMIKGVVKIAVATTNIKRAKKKIVNKLDGISEEDFRERYSGFYELIKDLPPDLKSAYKITPHMSKEQMVRNVESVDKKKIYRIIGRIPDKTIAMLFKEYLRGAGFKETKSEKD